MIALHPAAFRAALSAELAATEASHSSLHADAWRAAIAAQAALVWTRPALSEPGRLAAEEMLTEFWRTVGEVGRAWAEAHFRYRCFTEKPMLAMWFCHDGGQTNFWRLKGHAQRDFWRWVCSWAALVRAPSDLGYPDDGYVLPPLRIHQVTVEGQASEGCLFPVEARTMQERLRARKASIAKRVRTCAEIVAREPDQAWIVWVDLNAESDAIAKAIPEATEVRGSDSPEDKEQALLDFAEGRSRVLLTKCSIAGHGLNMQRCARQAFVGLSDSWERYFQAIRRSHRFGQAQSVHIHVIVADTEGAVVRNIERKERDAQVMADEMAAHTRSFVQANVRGLVRTQTGYDPQIEMTIPIWLESAA